MHFSFGEKLPKSVYLKHGAYYFVTTVALNKVEWIPLGRDKAKAAIEYRRLVSSTKSDRYARTKIYDNDKQNSGPIPILFLREMLKNARKNAKSRNLECLIDLDAVKMLAERSGGKCQLTGFEFEYGVAKESSANSRRRRLWAPSLDRIDSEQGYTVENLRIICFAVNAAKQEFGDEVLFKIAKGLSNMQKSCLLRD